MIELAVLIGASPTSFCCRPTVCMSSIGVLLLLCAAVLPVSEEVALGLLCRCVLDCSFSLCALLCAACCVQLNCMYWYTIDILPYDCQQLTARATQLHALQLSTCCTGLSLAEQSSNTCETAQIRKRRLRGAHIARNFLQRERTVLHSANTSLNSSLPSLQ